jgi:hypothetical protein
MKIRARRGVCIGVDRHLVAGDLVDLETAQVTFLVGIGAVEVVPDEPPSKTVPTEAPASVETNDSPTDLGQPAERGRSSKKEK